MENTVVDSARHFRGQSLPSLFHSLLPRLLPASSHHETIVLSGVLGVWFTYLFLVFAFFFFPPKLPLSLKAHFFLLIIFRSFYHEEEQEGIHSTMHFHVLNLISASHSYFPCRAQFAVSPEAWGRGPSRRRLILLALSLLREINALWNIWCMPSSPLAEPQKHLPGGLHALK